MKLPVLFSHESNCIYDDVGNKVLRIISLERSEVLAELIPALNSYRQIIENQTKKELLKQTK